MWKHLHLSWYWENMHICLLLSFLLSYHWLCARNKLWISNFTAVHWTFVYSTYSKLVKWNILRLYTKYVQILNNKLFTFITICILHNLHSRYIYILNSPLCFACLHNKLCTFIIGSKLNINIYHTSCFVSIAHTPTIQY